jgi:rhodanese-related sulfurtransferase/transcriptional regulator with XRE-family HTH domain
MVRTLGAREAEALIAAGEVDVVDVRDPREWASGHISGARNVPLEDLRAEPRAKLPRDQVLFVCARGVRSRTAAELAEQLGLKGVSTLDGGLQAWSQAGLPLETPPDAAPARAPEAATAPAPDASCGLPEPGLDAVVGANLRELRTQRQLSLDTLARLTGLSRTLLGQIELGKAAPSVSVVWRIARAFDVPFSALLVTSERVETSILRRAQAKRLVSPDGRFSSRALFSPGEKTDVEFYELYLAAHSREDALPHQPGTRENLIVTAGRLELEVSGERFELGKGDAILFTADVPHSYANPGHEECWMYLVMTYASRATSP